MLLLLSLAVNFMLSLILDWDFGFFIFVEFLQENFHLFDFITLDFRQVDYSNFTDPDFDHF